MPLEVLLEQKNYVSGSSKQNVKNSLEGHCMSVGFLAVSNSNQALHLRPERITRELWGFTEVGGELAALWGKCTGLRVAGATAAILHPTAGTGGSLAVPAAATSYFLKLLKGVLQILGVTNWLGLGHAAQ